MKSYLWLVVIIVGMSAVVHAWRLINQTTIIEKKPWEHFFDFLFAAYITGGGIYHLAQM